MQMVRSNYFNEKQFLKVQLLTKKVIKPSSPTPDHLQTYKLSFFDQLSPPSHVSLIYLYPIDDQDTVDEPGIAKKHQTLQNSLAQTLSHFYPIAGRFSKNGPPSIDCKDQGVVYIEAKVNCQLTEFRDESHKNVDLLSQFFPQDNNAGDAIGRVQVTFFECGGFALTGLISHTLVDGFTGCTFFHEWAKICKFGFSKSKPLSFNMASVFPPRDLSGILKPFPAIKHVGEIFSKRILFDELAIQSLKNNFGADHSSIELLRPSRVELVLAFVWRGLIRAARARHGYLRASVTSFPVNLRGKKISMEIPMSSFGNLFIPVPIKFLPDEKKMGLHHFVELIRRTSQKAQIDCAKALSGDDFFSMVLKCEDEFKKAICHQEVDFWMSSSLCRFPLYEADFGWGKPSWISNTHGKAPLEMFTLLDTECGTGIEVLLYLNDIEMRIFESDHEIAAIISPGKSP